MFALLCGTASAAGATKSDSDIEATLAEILEILKAHGGQLEEQQIQVLAQATEIAKNRNSLKENLGITSDAAQPQNGFRVGDTDVEIHGFIKLDASLTDYDGGELPSSNIGDDFYIPGLIPVGGSGDGADFGFNSRESRFLFTTKTDLGEHMLGSKVEMDFQVTNGGDERISNSYTPRLRQAYITYDNWLLGQAWTTFQDVSALPDNLDFIGPTEGTVFARQPMVRYTRGAWELALEQPETTLTPNSGGARVIAGDDVAPDAVVRYTHRGDWGHLRAAAIARALHAEEGATALAQDDTVTGYGLSLSGKLRIGSNDDFRFMLTAGEGLGRYMGLNIVNDAVIDGNGNLEAIPTLSGFTSYRHVWSGKWRSNFTLGFFQADNPVANTGTGVTKEVYSTHVNMIYSPLGVEYINATRELESGEDGGMDKLQLSAKYAF
jgi:hypothetical protein